MSEIPLHLAANAVDDRRQLVATRAQTLVRMKPQLNYARPARMTSDEWDVRVLAHVLTTDALIQHYFPFAVYRYYLEAPDNPYSESLWAPSDSGYLDVPWDFATHAGASVVVKSTIELRKHDPQRLVFRNWEHWHHAQVAIFAKITNVRKAGGMIVTPLGWTTRTLFRAGHRVYRDEYGPGLAFPVDRLLPMKYISEGRP